MNRDIAALYDEYRIPPWLRMHMYRVAAVAATLFDARAARLTAGRATLADRDTLITACLVHDLGNIIKFNFDALLMMRQEDRAHWETIQAEIISRYGTSAHQGTLLMLDEIGVSSEVRRIVDAIGFENVEHIEREGDILVQLAQYADTRVVPAGVASLDERMRDMYLRYGHLHPEGDAETARRVAALKRLEEALFAGLSLRPEDITETSVAPLRETLTHFDIGTVPR